VKIVHNFHETFFARSCRSKISTYENLSTKLEAMFKM